LPGRSLNHKYSFPDKRAATEGHPYSSSVAQADVPAVGARVHFLENAAKVLID
jgi:hypothetical protein